MRRVQVPVTGLAIILALVSCGQPPPLGDGQPPTPAVTMPRAPSRMIQQGRPRFDDRCNPRQAANATERIARQLVRRALVRHDVGRHATYRERERAEREMAQFLRWKFRGNVGVCRAYRDEGRAGPSRHTDEAAAMVLGILQMHNGSPVVTLPDWFQHYVRLQARGHSRTALTAALRDLGLSRRLSVLLAGEMLHSGTYGERVAVRLPYREDLENAVIRAAVKAKELRRLAGHSALGRDRDQVAPLRPVVQKPGRVRQGPGPIRGRTDGRITPAHR